MSTVTIAALQEQITQYEAGVATITNEIGNAESVLKRLTKDRDQTSGAIAGLREAIRRSQLAAGPVEVPAAPVEVIVTPVADPVTP